MPSVSNLLNRFDDPDDKVKIAVEGSISKNEQELLGKVEGIFETLLENDEEARDRCKNLDGL